MESEFLRRIEQELNPGLDGVESGSARDFMIYKYYSKLINCLETHAQCLALTGVV